MHYLLLVLQNIVSISIYAIPQHSIISTPENQVNRITYQGLSVRGDGAMFYFSQSLECLRSGYSII